MKLKWLISTAALALLIAVALFGLAGRDSIVAAQDLGDKIEVTLLDRFSTDGNSDFIIRFVDQADLSAAPSMEWSARGEYVVNTLQATADKSQLNAKAILDAAGLKYQTFIAGNDLYVWSGSLVDADALAALPEVSYIRATRTYSIDPVGNLKPFDNIRWAGDFLANNLLTEVGDAPDGLAWGITYTGADQFWTNFGVQGDGMLVANIDTGVQWNHPALDQAYKCPGDPGNASCWDDPSNICGGTPCDNQGHGTHTMGTMVGDDDPGLTWEAGMAPNAQWIACKGCESNNCSDFALNACADWVLQPGGNPSNRPDVVNNSWGGGGGDTWYQAKVQAWVSAGIFPAFSAGNNGSGCNTLGSPGDYQESFGSAAHDSSGNIASFSSRGPSAFGHEPYTKPNITAPGVSVCSSVPTNAWSCAYSGTSMASPHTAGAVALLWSCNPSLVGQIDATFNVLQNSTDVAPAGNCGAPPDGEGNYTFGYGYLNVLNAGISTCGGVALGTLDGHVYDVDGNPIEGASVNATPAIEGNQIQAITDPNGYYTMDLIVGTYDVTASKTGFASQTINGVVVNEGLTTTQDFTLAFLGQWTPGPSMCFDWTRLDGEYYPGTGKIYFMGGRSDTNTIGTIYSFDPQTSDCVATGAVMPNPVSNYTISLVNNGSADLLCTFGGRQADGNQTLNVQCYNPNTNNVSVVTNLPAAWTGYSPGGQVVVDNNVYLFGGFNPSVGMIARTDKYDPVANAFTQLGNLNLARSYIMAASVDGIIYAFGGDTWDGASLIAQSMAEKMDPAVGTWDDAGVADLPQPGDEGRAFGFDSNSPYDLANQIVLATLSQWSGSSEVVVSYDVGSNTYNVDFPDLINARRNHAGVFVPINTDAPDDGLPGMWVFGGYFGSDLPPYAPTEFFPMAVTTPEPDIQVTPDALTADLVPNDTTTQELTIKNVGSLPLNWLLTESEGMKIDRVTASSPLSSATNASNPTFNGIPVKSYTTSPETAAQYTGPLAVLYDQTDNGGTNGFPSQDFEPAFDAYDDQGADDFVVPAPGWAIQSLYVIGSSNGGLPVPFVNVFFYADDAGLPGAQIYAAYGIVPVDDGDADLTVTLPVPAILSEGKYWLTVQAAMDYGTYGQFFWSTRAVQSNDPYAWINPGDGFATGCTSWSYGASDCGVGGGVDPDALFRLEGTTLVDVPWLSEAPTSGMLDPGESVVVEVTFDSAGLTAGEYLAALDVSSNDPDEPVVNVPVTLNVLAQADLGITKTDNPDPVRVGDNLTYSLLVTNDGPQDATGVTVVDTLPDGVTFVSASAGCNEVSGVVTCDVGDLASGDGVAITIVVTADVEGVITNTATVEGNEVDPDLTNNEAFQGTTVIPATLYIYLPIITR